MLSSEGSANAGKCPAACEYSSSPRLGAIKCDDNLAKLSGGLEDMSSMTQVKPALFFLFNDDGRPKPIVAAGQSVMCIPCPAQSDAELRQLVLSLTPLGHSYVSYVSR